MSPTRVSLTTYYGKLFLEKSDRKTFNMEKYLIQNIQTKIFDEKVFEVDYGSTFDKSIQNIHPYYQMISKRFKQFKYRDESNQDWLLTFDYHHRDRLTNGNLEVLTKLEEANNGTLFAVNLNTKESLYIERNNGLVYSSNVNLPPKTLEKFFNFEQTPPIEMVDIKVFSKAIPVGILLGYYLGLTKLCKLLNIKPRKIFRGQRANLTETEYQIQFGDESWIFDKRDYKASLILNGFNHYRRYITDYSANQFDDKDVYMAILRDAGIPLSYENEFKMMKRMFIDDISKSLLQQEGEPDTFIPLLIRGVELLTTLWSRPEINMEDMLISGYDRIAGHVYKELVGAIKTANGTSIHARKRFDIPENRIFQAIQQDPSVALVDDINPIHTLKEHDIVTFNGAGGRSGRSMVAHTRKYDQSDLGVISEATVDNANVGTITYLSGNPNLNGLYGNANTLDEGEYRDSAKVFSTTSTLYVGSDVDDQK